MRRFRLIPIALLALALVPAAQNATTRTVNDGNVVLDGVPDVPSEIGERLRRYQNIRGAGVVDWSQGGESLYISTRFGDVSQLHRVDAPRGQRTQLTFFDEPARGVARRPHGETILFSMDQSGSELYQLFLLDPATGAQRLITDGESRNSSPLWSRDGSLLAFTSTKRNGRSNDVYAMPAERPGDARMVFEAPDGALYRASDWRADGKALLVTQYVSVTDSRILLVDLETGDARLVAGGGDEPASYTGVTPQFTPDGRGVLTATDAAGEFRQLTRIDLESGELESLTAGIPWDVSSLVQSADRRRAAFTTNAGGLSELYLLDPASLAFEKVGAMPIGLISGLRFSPDGRRLAFSWSGPKTPGDVYSLELGESSEASAEPGEIVRWTFSEVGGLDTDSFVEPELVSFPTFDLLNGKRREIPAFVYKPEGEGPHPVIVSIHGGPEGQHRPGFRGRYQLWVRELGVAVIAPNVRGSSGYGKTYLKLDNGFLREDSVKDIGALLDWIAIQPDLDEERVAVSGGSYGGYMVLASAVHFSDRLRAAVDIVGISNFVSFLENTQDYRRDLRRVEYGDERDPDMRAHLEKISPSNQADRITVPLFVAQGQNDPRVPVTESEQIVREVRANGHDVWYMNALNEGHGFRKKENRDLFAEITVLFLQQTLLREGPEVVLPRVSPAEPTPSN